MCVRRKATFFIPCCRASWAPVHMRAPLISTPMKFLEGQRRPSPTVYSPRPHPSSRTMGLSLWKKSECHLPLRGKSPCCITAKGHSMTSGLAAISANFANFPFPILVLFSWFVGGGMPRLWPSPACQYSVTRRPGRRVLQGLAQRVCVTWAYRMSMTGMLSLSL